MIAAPEQSPERDAALEAALAHIPCDGWTLTALRRGLAEAGADPAAAATLFPGGTADMIAAFCDLADRRMVAALAGPDHAGLRTSGRVRAAILLRLEQAAPHREAARRALAELARPRHAALAAACTARTVDAIWAAAGDRSDDIAWYTKRAILALVLAATTLFWLSPAGEDPAALTAFLDRRLDGVARLGRLRARLACPRARAA
ncbi:MAG: COQ9 family protein [Acetobacteraceae bacterium]